MIFLMCSDPCHSDTFVTGLTLDTSTTTADETDVFVPEVLNEKEGGSNTLNMTLRTKSAKFKITHLQNMCYSFIRANTQCR